MIVAKKTMRREDWRRILDREYVWHSVNLPEMTGEAGLIRMNLVSAPFVRSMFGSEYNLADTGYAWLQIAPRGENWWATVMFDRERKLVQAYFDVTRENCIRENGDSFFYDLFVDVVYIPGAGIAVLDEDELEQALEEGVICEDEYRLALGTAERLVNGLETRGEELEAFCHAQWEALEGKLEI